MLVRTLLQKPTRKLSEVSHFVLDFRQRSERNFYLHGFTLFLSLILSRVYSLVLDLIKAQEDLAIIKAQVRKFLLF